MNVFRDRCSAVTKFGELRSEPATLADYDKFLEGIEVDYPEVCNGRSVWTVAYERLRRYGARQEPGDKCWSKLQDHEVYFWIQGLPQSIDICT